MKKQPAPLIIEQHPKDYTGFEFITLVQYHKTPLLCIVDNSNANVVRAYVLDMCGPAEVNEEMVITATQDWFENFALQYPVSIHYAKLGITSETAKIYRALNVEFISRAIGPIAKYPTAISRSVKRRRRKPLPASIEIHCNEAVID